MVINICVKFISSFFPKNNKLIVFGAWNGERFSDNSKAMIDYITRIDPEYTCVWIGSKKLEETVLKSKNIFIEKGSVKAFFTILKAKYVFVTHSYRDVVSLNITGGSKLIQLWHGFPVKKIVADVPFDKGNYNNHHEKYDYYVTSSKIESARYLSAFRYWGIKDTQLIEAGQPRNDIFEISQIKKNNIRDKLRNELNLKNDEKVILYMPTYRENSINNFSFLEETSIFNESLKKSGKVIIERQHFKQKINKNKFEYSNIKEIPQSVDTQELLLLADVLITDYSSIYVDFILQDKPVVHYLYDKNYYINNDRGVYGKFENQVVGPIVMDIDRLKNMILSNNEDVYLPEVRKKMNIYFNEFNLKNNSEHIWKQINNED